MNGVRRLWPFGSGTTPGLSSFGPGRGRLLFVALGVALYLGFDPSWPTEQHLRLSLGDAAASVEEIRIRCGSDSGRADDWVREVTFHFAKGKAPRILAYEPKLKSGQYVVEIEMTTDDTHVTTIEHLVRFERGTTTTIDLRRENALGAQAGSAD